MVKTKIKSPLLDMLGIDYPIIQAGMGPFSTKSLAAAVSNAGGLGTVSVPTSHEPEFGAKMVIEHIHEVQRTTDRNFAVNTPVGSAKASVGLIFDTFDAIINAVVNEKKKDPDLRKRLVLYITSGGNPTRYHEKIKDAGFIHFHLVGSVYHAKRMEELGVDGVIASGYEMGGHTHLADRAIHTFVLVPAVVQAVKIPVISSGGVCDAATLAASLALGAVGVQMGTRFIATKECDFHENYKRAIIEAGEFSTIVIPSFIAPARQLKNPAAYEIIEAEKKVERGELDPGEKAQMVDDAFKIVQEKGDVERGVLGAGQCCGRVNDLLTVKEVIDSTVEGAAQILRRLHSELIEV